MHFTDEKLQKWKVEYLRKYLQWGVPIVNNARKTNLFEKVIFAQKLDLPIQQSEAKKNVKRNFLMQRTTNWALMVLKHLTPVTSKKIGLL